ncbi:YigZ family protein [Litoribacter ruber]|uniref:YigZ family protein n=1 Tax=Litoribacter ruber TaxID=702568 RepID=A0AAP2CG77_9BACT|nr:MULTISPECIES: YigZ family protein [Litoribacter]MBS9522944.1 YigZ family protein [Litoribacter alkaliphilus]MBT0810892.1 YigZ family protein [Litoribacter ruber]
MDDTYLTLAGESESLYKEKGSKFLAFAYPVSDEDEIKERLEALRKKYYDARHHCYAYMLGKDQDQYRANDDGEPNHSAGDPILGQIRSHNLTNVLIVVVRYFGGTKLGVGGLITAYKSAAAEAIESNQIITEIVTLPIKFTFDYLDMNDVMRLIKDYDLTIKSQDFDNTCKMAIRVREANYEIVKEKLGDIGSVKIL